MRFVDLCSGIGGFRLGLSALGHECVYSCEIDRHACEAYEANYGHAPESNDVMALTSSALPPHELVVCGFPCRTFSRAGSCTCDMSLIKHVVQTVCAGEQTRFLMLENTSTFPTVGGGGSYRELLAILHGAGFDEVHDAVYCVADVTGLPQPRKRWLCVAARGNGAGVLDAHVPVAPVPVDKRMVISDVLCSPADWAPRNHALYLPDKPKPFPQKRSQKICWVGSRSRNHRQHTRVFHRNGIGYTLTASGRIYVHEPKKRKGKEVDRLLSARELVLYMGFPKTFVLPNQTRVVSTRLLGSAVPPKLIERVAGSFQALNNAAGTTDADHGS